jgi:hypothetical protein
MHGCCAVVAAVTLRLGPLLPDEKNVPFVVGAGYIAGDFALTVLLGTTQDAVYAVWRRRAGVLVASLALLLWLKGRVLDDPVAGLARSEAYPTLPTERSLADVAGWFGLGPLFAAAFGWVVYGRHSDVGRENQVGEQTGRSIGLLLGGIYIGLVWLGPNWSGETATTAIVLGTLLSMADTGLKLFVGVGAGLVVSRIAAAAGWGSELILVVALATGVVLAIGLDVARRSKRAKAPERPPRHADSEAQLRA